MRDRDVLVTGANSGIGLATALELAGAGARVLGTVRSDAKGDVLRDAARGRDLADRVEPVRCDVSDPADCTRGLADVAARTGGGPWAVVNNAGFAQAGTVEDVDDDQARAQLEVNLVAVGRVTRELLPAMRARGDGRVVNVGSVAGRVSLPLMGWYCASKAGLAALTASTRMEVAPFGIGVALVEPGSFGTAIWPTEDDVLPEPSTPEYARAYDTTRVLDRLADAMPDPVWVARVIRVALSSPVMLPRYLVGADAAALTAADRLAPALLADHVKSVAAGLRRPWEVLPGEARATLARLPLAGRLPGVGRPGA